jgi:hypothetical protein
VTATTALAAGVHEVGVDAFTRMRVSVVHVQAAFAAHLPDALVAAHVYPEFPDDLGITITGAATADVEAAADLYLASCGATYRIDTHGEPS